MKEILIGIISSVIATLIIALCRPLIKRIGTNIIEAISRISKNYRDRIYKEASFRSFLKIPRFNLGVSMFFLAFLCTGLLTYMFTTVDIRIDELSESSTEIRDEILGKKKNDLSLDQQLRKSLKETRRSLEESSSFRTQLVGFAIFFVILFLVHYVRYMRQLFVADLITNFKRDLALLRPHIEQNEFILIGSMWAGMKSKEDFDEIMDKLAAVRKKAQ